MFAKHLGKLVGKISDGHLVVGSLHLLLIIWGDAVRVFSHVAELVDPLEEEHAFEVSSHTRL